MISKAEATKQKIFSERGAKFRSITGKIPGKQVYTGRSGAGSSMAFCRRIHFGTKDWVNKKSA